MRICQESPQMALGWRRREEGPRQWTLRAWQDNASVGAAVAVVVVVVAVLLMGAGSMLRVHHSIPFNGVK